MLLLHARRWSIIWLKWLLHGKEEARRQRVGGASGPGSALCLVVAKRIKCSDRFHLSCSVLSVCADMKCLQYWCWSIHLAG
jgi:hypothetical protein